VPAYKKLPRYPDCLTVLCPVTMAAIPTLIGTDVRTLAKKWYTKIKVSCPYCRETHQYTVREAFVETAISNARLRGEVCLQGDAPRLLDGVG
jgi:hypothetical protein